VVGNVRVTYATDDDHWEVAAFANNVTDTEYRIYNLDL
jgi:iron complex outermembrane receptor protein